MFFVTMVILRLYGKFYINKFICCSSKRIENIEPPKKERFTSIISFIRFLFLQDPCFCSFYVLIEVLQDPCFCSFFVLIEGPVVVGGLSSF